MHMVFPPQNRDTGPKMRRLPTCDCVYVCVCSINTSNVRPLWTCVFIYVPHYRPNMRTEEISIRMCAADAGRFL